MRRYNCATLQLLVVVIGIAIAPATPAAAQATVAESHKAEGDLSGDSLQTSLELQAAIGNAQAQFALGSLYSSVALDDELAVEWWRKAAEQGMADAQNELGSALAAGRGVEADPGQAVAWFRKAAEQGLAVAQANLGLMYWNGDAMRPKPREAVVWFRRAADQDLAWAQIFLGDAYARGRGVRRDFHQAIQWYRKAASQNYTDAQVALGEVYLRGPRTVQDSAEALRWFALAARQGSEAAQQNLRNIAGRLRRTRLVAGVAVREGPDPTSSTIRTATGGEYAYVVRWVNDWTEVYLPQDHTVGFMSAADLKVK